MGKNQMEISPCPEKKQAVQPDSLFLKKYTAELLLPDQLCIEFITTNC